VLRRFITVFVVAMLTVASTALSDPTPEATAQRSPRVAPARIAVGFDHGCAVTPAGGVECWGDNTYGELGVPLTVTMSATPVAVNLPTGWSAVDVGVGEHHTCALLVDGRVGCWGQDSVGQRGNVGGDQSPGPVLADLPRPAVALSVGPTGSCAIVDNGEVWCWGFQYNGELGQLTNGVHESPQLVPMPAAAAAVDVSTHHTHTCAVLDTGAITCWGDNTSGQFGNGTTTASSTTGSASAPITLAAGVRAVDVDAGSDFTCAVGDNGRVYCWGFNGDGRLGDGTTTQRSTPGLVTPTPFRQAVRVTAGDQHACALMHDGALACWGDNSLGQVGDATTDGRISPVTVAPGALAQAIVTSVATTCAVLTEATVTCWGRNNWGQVGDGTTIDRTSPSTPRHLGGGTRAVAVAAGGNHTCLLNSEGLVWCWGANSVGQLGRGTDTLRELHLGDPVTLPSPGRAQAITAGTDHTCALLTDGRVSCWGSNSSGQLGTGMNTPNRSTPSAPINLQGSGRAKVISAGGSHTCALHTDGTIACWGYNLYGQLGDGGTNNQFSTHDVVWMPGGSTAIAVTTGLDHTCALKGDGAMVCWGRNHYGQLGDASTTQRTSAVTVGVPAGTKAIAIDAGRFHTCALLSGGSVTCWGDNYHGQLGLDPTTTAQLTSLSGTLSLPGGHPTKAVGLSVGDSHTCVLLSDGRAACWGYNGTGELGDGTTTTRFTPALVGTQPMAAGIRALAAGFTHHCAVLDNGSVSCWGQNFNGQLGTGDRDNRPNPDLGASRATPTDLHGVTKSAGVVLTWTEPRSPYQPQTWLVETSTDNTTWWPATVSAVSPSGTTVSGLATNTPHRFRVTSTTPLDSVTITLTESLTITAADEVAPPPPPPAPAAPVASVPTELVPPTAAQIAALPLRTMVDPAMLRVGATVTVDADGFTPGQTVMVMVASTPQVLDMLTADDDGALRVRVHIPADLGAGEHNLAVWAPASGTGFRQLFGGDDDSNPEPAPPAPPAPAVDPTGQLPSTGTDPHTLLAVALMCCIVGLTLKRRWGPAVARGPLRG
jgi:alpha-tubulin suppressor-like RCC1 family protein